MSDNDFVFYKQVHGVYTRKGEEKLDRESWVLYVYGLGGVEVWRTKTPEPIKEVMKEDHYGGVEVHYEKETESTEEMHYLPSCTITGGECWTAGSSFAFETVREFFEDPVKVREYLIERAEIEFDLELPEMFSVV